MDFYLYVYYQNEYDREWKAIRPLEGTKEDAKQLEDLLNKMNPDKDYKFVVECDEVTEEDSKCIVCGCESCGGCDCN